MESEGQRYARQLFPLHGYALWVPEPNDDLPPCYSDHGIRIGDVGIVTSDGCFDFLFNICLSADDPINCSRGVPSNFVPLVWNHQLTRTPNRFRPGVPLCSRKAKQRELGIEASTLVPGSPFGIGGGIEISFSQDSGAVLMPPKGADRTDCAQLAVFREYAEKNAEEWYRFVNCDHGREAENGSLYLITGFDKTDAWETALFDSSSSSHSCSLIFNTGGLADGRLKLSRSSIYQSSVTSRCSVPDAKHNQCIFLRGFRVSLRQPLLRRVDVKVTSTSSSSKDVFDSMGQPHINGLRPDSTSGRSSSAGSQSSVNPSSPLLDSYENDDFRSAHDTDNGDDTASNTSLEDGDLDFTPQAYHPLSVINNFILTTYPKVNVVVTHDDDWMALLSDKDLAMPDDRIMEQRFREMYDVATINGSLRLRTRSPLHNPCNPLPDHLERMVLPRNASPGMYMPMPFQSCYTTTPTSTGALSPAVTFTSTGTDTVVATPSSKANSGDWTFSPQIPDVLQSLMLSGAPQVFPDSPRNIESSDSEMEHESDVNHKRSYEEAFPAENLLEGSPTNVQLSQRDLSMKRRRLSV